MSKRGRISFDTPLYKYEVTLRRDPRPGVVFARDAGEADDIAAALSGEPQSAGLLPGRLVRTRHHPRLRGGLYEFTYGERLHEAHLRQRSAMQRSALR